MFLIDLVVLKLHIAALLGWQVRRVTDYDGEEFLQFFREDIVLRGMTYEPTDGPAPCLLISLPVDAQEYISKIVRGYADTFSINRYVSFCVDARLPVERRKHRDYVAMAHEVEVLREVMEKYCSELERLKNSPKFSQTPNSKARMAMVQETVKKLGIYLSPDCRDQLGGWMACYDMEHLGTYQFYGWYYPDEANKNLEDDLGNIEETIEEIRYKLAHFDDEFEKILIHLTGYEIGFMEKIQEAHEIHEALEELADAFEHKSLETLLAS